MSIGTSFETISANTFTVTHTTPQKKRQVAKVTPFEKVEEQVENEGRNDNLAQEVFMLETRDSLDSPPLNEIEDDPLAGFESNEGNNDVVEPQPSTSGFGMLRLANFAIDPANVSSSSNHDNSSSLEQSSSWHIAQGVAPPEEPDPSIPVSSLISTLPIQPLPPEQAFSNNFSTFVVQPPSQVVQPTQTNLTVQFPIQLLSKELNICYPLLCNAEAHRSDYVILTMHMNNSIYYFAKLFIPLRKASLIFTPRSISTEGNFEFIYQKIQCSSSIILSGTSITASMNQFMSQGQSQFRLSFVTRGLPDIESMILHEMHDILNSIRQQLLFIVLAGQIRQMQAQCWSSMKQLFINYAVDISGRRNQLMSVDVSKSSVDSFAEPFFDFLDHGTIITNHERTKATTRLRSLFELFKIGLNARDAETMIFNRNRSKVQYKNTLVRLVSQKEAEQRSLGQNFPYRFSADEKFTCQFCDYHANTKAMVHEHTTLFHYCGRIGKLATCDSCPFRGCNQAWPSLLRDRMLHLGVYHQVVVTAQEELITELRKKTGNTVPNITPKSSLFKCPIAGCQHRVFSFCQLMEHFHELHDRNNYVQCLIKNLQACLNLKENICPIENCKITSNDPNVLTKHVALQHFALLREMLNVFEATKNNTAANLLMIFIKNLSVPNGQNGPSDGIDRFINYGCNFCKKLFGSQNELNYHKAKEHITNELLQAFSKLSRDVAGKKLCTLCSKPFANVYSGSFHLGVAHSPNERNLALKAQTTKEQTRIEVVQPQQRNRSQQPVGNNVIVYNITTSDEILPERQVAATVVYPGAIQQATANVESNWYYQCPICASKVNLGNDQQKSSNALIKHVVTVHQDSAFTEILNKMNLHCPVRGCQASFRNMRSQKDHVINSHISYLNDFLKKFLKGLCIKDCLIQANPSELPLSSTSQRNNDEDIIILDHDQPSLLEKYLNYCQEHKFDPFNCPVFKINGFINHAFSTLNFSGENIKQVLREIQAKHSNKNLKEEKMIKFTLSRILPLNSNQTEVSSSSKGISIPTASPRIELKKTLQKSSYKASSTTINLSKNCPFSCQTCGRQYEKVRELIQHFDDTNHSEISIGCQYCDFKKVFPNIDVANTFLTLHTFSKTHLFNRWRVSKNSDSKVPVRRLTESQLTQAKCDICSEEVVDLGEHCLSKNHRDKATIVNLYVANCDRKMVCPTNCSIEDLTFLIERIAYKCLAPDPDKRLLNVNMLIILGVLDKMHDSDVFANPVLNGKVQQLFTIRQAPLFTCYSCGFFAKDLKTLSHHVLGNEHRTRKLKFKDKDVKIFECLACYAGDKTAFGEYFHVELHAYTKEHIQNSYAEYAGMVKPLVKNDVPETKCVLCDTLVFAGQKHCLQSPNHVAKKAVLDAYLDYCKEKNIHPLASTAQVAKMAIEGFQASDKAKTFSYQELRQALKVWNLEKSLKAPAPMVVKTEPSEKAVAKKLEFETYGLDREECDLVTRCPECNFKFNHATYLLYHMTHVHRKKPSKFIGEIMKNHNRLFTCKRCMKKCKSPIILAIHHDRHQIQGKLLTCPFSCKKNYPSPAAYYSADNCKKNSLPESVKKEVDKIILKAVERSPFDATIGCRETFLNAFKDVQTKNEKKRQRSRSSSSEDESLQKKARVEDSEQSEDNFEEPMDYDDHNETDTDSYRSRSVTPDYNLKRVRIEISRQDQDRAKKAIKLEEMKAKYTRPCSVVIKKNIASGSRPPPVIDKPEPKRNKPGPKGSKPGPKRRNPEPKSLRRPGPKRSREEPQPAKEIYKPREALIEYKPGPKSRRSKPESVKMIRISLTPRKDPHFCLDCELCFKKCSHLDHPRRIVDRVDEHIQQFAHGRFQKIEDFVMQPKLKLTDMAYSDDHGADIRKQYKKYVEKSKEDSPVNLYEYPYEKKCLKCDVTTKSIVYMFRHIRQQHLSKDNGE